MGQNKMYNFGNANEAQRDAISTVDGPVLITAGPGTGKTFTLVQRAIYLIEECGVMPENIFIATFTEKAAKELITRITNELAKRNIMVNLNEMYVGTFHSLCLRILKDNLEYTRLKKNFRILDQFEQEYFVFQHIKKFRDIPGVEKIQINKKEWWNQANAWKKAKWICSHVNNLEEELIDPSELIKNRDRLVSAMGLILKSYQVLINESNILDFSSIQVETFHLLQEHPNILKRLQSQISHIMVDEYQDTNYIQEQFAIMLAGENENICVVGDDDQGLYRFRGATIRNILEFPQKGWRKKCKTISLTVNYRSNSDIVAFYNKWMATTTGGSFGFEWGKYRYNKKIVAHNSRSPRPAVIRISIKEQKEKDKQEEMWHKKILTFLKKLKYTGKISDYNQIAFLFPTVKNSTVRKLANYLEKNKINVYSPRSNMFFQRNEIKFAIGCLILMFPNYEEGLKEKKYRFLIKDLRDYYLDCISYVKDWLSKPQLGELNRLIYQKGREHKTLKTTTDYAFSGLLYQMFQFLPFSPKLNVNMGSGVVDMRPTRNLAMLTQIIGKYEYIYKIDVLSGIQNKSERKIDHDTEILFNMYLQQLFRDGISEYEDDTEYAPSGCISFLTIHQAKGMEFPIVVVDPLWDKPRANTDYLMSKIEDDYFRRPTFEPNGDKKYFDFWRLYYTAFSRAQDLLVLTCDKSPSECLRETYYEVEPVESPKFNLKNFKFEPIKDVNIKPSFAFTSDIAVYETCPRQYKFYKELDFSPVRASSMLFGVLVHETIEDVHKAALRREEQTITDSNIEGWFESNYLSLSKSEHAYLAEPQKKAALNQVLKYVERQHGDWSKVQQAEVEVSLVKEDYIIDGKIDLIRGDENSVDIVDFKTDSDLFDNRTKQEHYLEQLNIYAYLVEQRTGKKVRNMHLYCTSGNQGKPTITFPYQKEAVTQMMESVDFTVKHILKKDFRQGCSDKSVCENCDFRYVCKKVNKAN